MWLPWLYLVKYSVEGAQKVANPVISSVKLGAEVCRVHETPKIQRLYRQILGLHCYLESPKGIRTLRRFRYRFWQPITN